MTSTHLKIVSRAAACGRCCVAVAFLALAGAAWGALLAGTESVKSFQTGSEQLTVYTAVPGHETLVNGFNPRARSDVYEIRVRSAATDNQWVQCFVNMTYNRAEELPQIDLDTGHNRGAVVQAYQRFTSGWTHSYANIEMSANSTVEVELRKIGKTLLNGSPTIVKAAVHPEQKIVPGSKVEQDGVVYFKINQPGQVVIDINGQMDDHNAAFPSDIPGGAMPGNANVHAVSLFANPILKKPDVKAPGVRFVKAGVLPPADTNFTTMVFGPGVHKIGPAFALHPGKSYYVPGDAILYGSFSNAESPTAPGYRSNGDRINLYGYGTLSGIGIPHYEFNNANKSYPEHNARKIRPGGGDKSINIVNAVDVTIHGLTIADPANFSTHIVGLKHRENDKGKISWVKAISWRANGDGLNGPITLEDCFTRASDDATYVIGSRIRCTFWKDANANIFRFIGAIRGRIEDCDVLYHRARDANGRLGKVFAFDSYDGRKPAAIPTEITVKNIRFHDRFPNMPIFGLDSVESFTGIKFENISAYTLISGKKSVILGSRQAPYRTRAMFKNVTFRSYKSGATAVLLNETNYKFFFETNEFVNPVIFRQP